MISCTLWPLCVFVLGDLPSGFGQILIQVYPMLTLGPTSLAPQQEPVVKEETVQQVEPYLYMKKAGDAGVCGGVGLGWSVRE